MPNLQPARFDSIGTAPRKRPRAHNSTLRVPAHRMKQTPLAKKSDKRRAEDSAWRPIRDAAFEDAGGRCVFIEENGERCPLPAVEGHHALARSQGGNAETTECLPLCQAHHDFCKSHPREAACRGYVVRRSDFDPVTMPVTVARKGAEA